MPSNFLIVILSAQKNWVEQLKPLWFDSVCVKCHDWREGWSRKEHWEAQTQTPNGPQKTLDTTARRTRYMWLQDYYYCLYLFVYSTWVNIQQSGIQIVWSCSHLGQMNRLKPSLQSAFLWMKWTRDGSFLSPASLWIRMVLFCLVWVNAK